ncbi:hypothetical protein QZH41_009315, partial [Actinostola sp. cb2023]
MSSEPSCSSVLEDIINENCPTAPPGTPGSNSSVENASTTAKSRDKPTTKGSKGKKPAKPATTTTGSGNDGSSRTSKGFDELSHKIDQLTTVVNKFAPVISELKAAYDASTIDDLSDSEADDEEAEGEPSAKKSKTSSDQQNMTVADGLVDVLVQEVTEDEQTDKILNEKIAKVLDNILASGLSDHVLTKRKEDVKRPENCKLLRVTKVNTEIWDIAQKTTRSMDARIQKMQESLIKGLIPLAYLTGTVGETMEKTSPMPTPEEADLDIKYKTICSSKEPVGSELFGDDLTERLKTVKERLGVDADDSDGSVDDADDSDDSVDDDDDSDDSVNDADGSEYSIDDDSDDSVDDAVDSDDSVDDADDADDSVDVADSEDSVDDADDSVDDADDSDDSVDDADGSEEVDDMNNNDGDKVDANDDDAANNE